MPSQIEVVSPAESSVSIDPVVQTYVEEVHTSPPVNGITDNADFSKSITLADSKRLTLRDIKAKDLLAVERAELFGNLERTFKLATLLCIEFGDKSLITEAELGELKGKDFLLLAQAIASFLE